MPDGGGLPFWPRALREGLAAAYVGLSGTTFRQVVAPEVPHIKLTASRVAWLREDLDAWLDRKKPTAANQVDGPPPGHDGGPVEIFNARAANAAGLANLAPKRGARRPHKAG